MQFERDPETSDTDNDVQFKVSSSFFKIPSPGGTVDTNSHTPHPEMERGGSSGTKASHPCGEEVRQPVVRCSCQRRDGKTG